MIALPFCNCPCFLAFLLILPATPGLSQVASTTSAQELLAKTKRARLQLDPLVVSCAIDASDIPEYPIGLTMTYEINEKEKHFLVIYDYSNCDDNNRKPISWQGRSGPYFVSGESGKQSRLAAWPRKDPMRHRPHFDVRALGLGFFGELKWGIKFEEVFANYASYQGLKTANSDETSLIYSSNGRPKIIIDKSRGFWPLKSELDHAEWRIRVETQNDIHVPIWFEFVRLDKGKRTGRMAVDLEWAIDSEFPVGRTSATTLADRYECKLVSLTEK